MPEDRDNLLLLLQVQFDGGAGFHRQMLWTFEDLRMLIGADLPVFSVGDHPCVSLRLRSVVSHAKVCCGCLTLAWVRCVCVTLSIRLR